MTNLFEKAKQTHFALNYERRMTYEKIRLFDYALQNELSELVDVDLGVQAYRIKKGIVSHYADPIAQRKFEDALFGKFIDTNNTDFVLELQGKIKKGMSELMAFANTSHEYSSKTEDELLGAYNAFCAKEQSLSLVNHLLFMVVERVLVKSLKHCGVTSEKLDALSQNSDMLPSEEYHADLVKVNIGELSVSELHKKYQHMGVGDVHILPKTQTGIKADSVEVATDKIVANEKFRISESVSGEPHVQNLLNYFTLYANNKEWKNFYREKTTLHLRNLLLELARVTGVAFDSLCYMHESEKQNLGEVDITQLKSASQNSLFLIYKDEFDVITDPVKLCEFDAMVESKKIILSGRSIYPGDIKGKVALVYSKEDFHKVDAETILITPTTRAEFLPYMKLAKAIVTNEGGLLSHAAILCRELKKPCLIGTKSATSVFSDGDIVFVSGKKGTVKKV